MAEKKDEMMIGTLYIPKSLYKRVKVFAAQKTMSMSQVIVEALQKFFEIK